jgi:hypothetical protein
MLGKMIFIPDEGNPCFSHLHYTRGLSPKDEVNEKNDSTYQSGAKIFYERLAKDFDLMPRQMKGKFTADFFSSGRSTLPGYKYTG